MMKNETFFVEENESSNKNSINMKHLLQCQTIFLKTKAILLIPFNGTGVFLYPLKTSESVCIERDQWHEMS